MGNYSGTLFEKAPIDTAKEQAPERELTAVEDTLRYIHAGNATFTIRSKETGTRFTYKVVNPERKKDSKFVPFNKNQKVWFVKVLTGSDNNSSYRYLGMLSEAANGERTFKFTKASPNPEAQSSKAFAWSYRNLATLKRMPPKVEIWHSGRCGCCGRLLTVPESIERGLGPECASKF
jgi:hypothetical protein